MAEVELEDGTSLCYESRGSGPLILVCSGGPNATFDYLMSDLEPLEEHFAVAFHDYRGSGRSGSAPGHTYTFEQLADDAAFLGRRLGYETFHVLAHSLGGMVALSLALRHPNAVDRLVLIATSPSGVASRMAVPTLKALGPRRAVKVAGRGLRYLLWWRWRPESEARTLARFSIMGSMQEGSPQYRAEVRRREVFADNDNAPHLERYASTFDLVDRLEEIKQQALVVYGSRDAPFAAGSRILLSSLPNATELRIGGSGHHPLIEDHDHVLAAVQRFLLPT